MNSDRPPDRRRPARRPAPSASPSREHPATVAEFAGLARSIAADRARREPLVQYDATSRWYHRLRTGPGYEVWLLPGCRARAAGRTATARSSGVLTVLAGELTERTERAASGPCRRARSASSRRGTCTRSSTTRWKPAVSLHVYYPGLTEMPMRARCPVAGHPRCRRQRPPRRERGTRRGPRRHRVRARHTRPTGLTDCPHAHCGSGRRHRRRPFPARPASRPRRTRTSPSSATPATTSPCSG